MKILRQTIAFIIVFLCVVASTEAVQEPLLVPEKATVDLGTNDNKNKMDTFSSMPVVPAVDTSVADNYPLVSKMEEITFGKPKPTELIEERLSALEQIVFCTTYKNQTLFDRTQKLKLTILGVSGPIGEEEPDFANSSILAPLLNPPVKPSSSQEMAPEATYFELIAKNADNQAAVEQKELPEIALQLINSARAQLNFPPLIMDKVAMHMAEEQVTDLRVRRVVSHINAKGDNPDLRYTAFGGTGAIMESLVSLKPDLVKDKQYTKALIANALKLLMDRQDDRESILSPDATGLGFSLELIPNEKRAIACIEISTTHGTIEPLLLPLRVGDKIGVRGSIEQPYRFAKITLAWEGSSIEGQASTEEIEEALPYFPPLDYVAYAHKSEHDYSGAMTALRIGCLAGVIAGSVFMPPVALAAPLLVMSTGPSEPKPMSDIPIRSGVKLIGESFFSKLPISDGGKAGIYYVTVWAMSSRSPNPIPVSRRAYMVEGKLLVK